MTRPAPEPLAPAEWGGFFAEHLAEVPLVVILRGATASDAVTTARAAWDAGVRLLEVTIERAEGVDALAAVVRDAGSSRVVGAGTLTTPDRVRAARDAGALFGVAPGLDRSTVQAAADHDLPFLPGVATASEVTTATAWGLSTVKAFPASVLGPGWVSAMTGPFPDLEVVATGGVNATNAADYLAAGAIGVGVGGAITGATALSDLVNTLRSL